MTSLLAADSKDDEGPRSSGGGLDVLEEVQVDGTGMSRRRPLPHPTLQHVSWMQAKRNLVASLVTPVVKDMYM